MTGGPIVPFGNGRDGRGRFTLGNRGGPGNPNPRRVAEIREVLRAAVTHDDLRAIVATLVESAKAGDVQAAREILDRLIGKPRQALTFGADDSTGESTTVVRVEFDRLG